MSLVRPASIRPIGFAGLLLAALLLLAASPAQAFCGFYVARADTQLYNQASQVVLVRDGDRTVITMASDFSGELDEFAMVVPVPTFIEREQIHVAEQSLIDHLDAYSAPRLVEYHDDDPCARREDRMKRSLAAPMASQAVMEDEAAELGVTVEATYTVGEYDILILSAEESGGLVTWLTRNGYRLPDGAEPVVRSYLRQGMRFFVAKVNLEEQAELGYQNLRPIQVAFEDRKFMLPIRLGTVNADGPQELFVYALTRSGRVETTNYRTVQLPTDQEIPTFVANDFARFYKDLFRRQVDKENGRAVFLEYAWDMAWCDPCAADPLTPRELRELGVFWVDADSRGPAQNVYVTRLHLRYDREHFPEDLRFQETGNRANFQGRYILRHPWTGRATCAAAETYRQNLHTRQTERARTLAHLTGWDLAEIRERMNLGDGPRKVDDEEPWWKRLWGG
ncbi:MAG: DUF2330 domain-containing protein [Acidobacteriota bacterium]|nr:DUF2330 domain-containing protein [Acidobacteriota bacterium]